MHISIKKENRLEFKIGPSDSPIIDYDNYKITFSPNNYSRVWFYVVNPEFEYSYKDVKIYLSFIDSKPIEIKVTNIDQDKFWNEFEKGQYSAWIREIGPREALRTPSLEFQFKEKGKYYFICTMNADGYKPVTYEKHFIVK